MPSNSPLSSSAPEERLLIVKPTALGDVAQAALVIPAIKQHRPNWRITWLVDKDYAPLARLCPGVDELIEFPRRRWRHPFRSLEILRWLFYLSRHRFTITLDLQGLARSAMMTLASGSRKRIGLWSSREGAFLSYNTFVRDSQKHAVDRYGAAIERLLDGQKVSDFHPLRKPGPPLHPAIKSVQYVLLHPYTLWETKLWPWERYSQLARLHPEVQFVMIGDGQHFPLETPNILDLRRQTTLQDLLSLCAHARTVVSTDSGPAHVAAAFGVPVITLFGATDPAKTAPRSAGSVALHGHVSCRPCLRRACRNSRPMQCMEEVSTEYVSAALGKRLAETSSPLPGS